MDAAGRPGSSDRGERGRVDLDLRRTGRVGAAADRRPARAGSPDDHCRPADRSRAGHDLHARRAAQPDRRSPGPRARVGLARRGTPPKPNRQAAQIECGGPLDLSSSAVKWRLCRMGQQGTPILEKDGEIFEFEGSMNGATVTLDSSDTQNLSGKYIQHRYLLYQI